MRSPITWQSSMMNLPQFIAGISPTHRTIRSDLNNEDLYAALTKLHPVGEHEITDHMAIVNDEPATVYRWHFTNPPHDPIRSEQRRSLRSTDQTPPGR